MWPSCFPPQQEGASFPESFREKGPALEPTALLTEKEGRRNLRVQMGPLQRLRRGSGRGGHQASRDQGDPGQAPAGTSTIPDFQEVCHLAPPTVQPRFPALSDFLLSGEPENLAEGPIGGKIADVAADRGWAGVRRRGEELGQTPAISPFNIQPHPVTRKTKVWGEGRSKRLWP